MNNENTAPAGELTGKDIRHIAEDLWQRLSIKISDVDAVIFARAITHRRACAQRPVGCDDGDATESVNATNTALATQYFEVLKKLEAYEKQGVTCQTFRHFVDVPCAECNAVVGPAVGDVAMPVIGWYGTNHAGCAAISQKESRVLRMFDLAQPLVKQSDAQAALAAKDAVIDALLNESAKLIITTNAEISALTAERDAALAASRYETDLCGQALTDRAKWKQSTIDANTRFQAAERNVAALTAERDALRKDAVAVSTQAARDVLAERQRQISVEGRTPEHDDKHQNAELPSAAVCYAQSYSHLSRGVKPSGWPWSVEWWKPKDRRSNLVRAAALLLAEIDRIDRAAMTKEAK